MCVYAYLLYSFKPGNMDVGAGGTGDTCPHFFPKFCMESAFFYRFPNACAPRLAIIKEIKCVNLQRISKAIGVIFVENFAMYSSLPIRENLRT